MTDSSTPTPESVAGPAEADDGRWYGSASAGHRPTDPEKHAWRAYFEATQMLEDLLERRLKAECGMTLADYNVLLLLTESEGGRLRLGELASRMVFSPSRVTYQVKNLVGRGLIERRAAECDRRGYEAVLTGEGRSAFRRAAAIHARQVDELFLERLEPGEADVLARVFSRVGRALEAHC